MMEYLMVGPITTCIWRYIKVGARDKCG